MPLDVFKEAPFRPDFADDPPDMRPEVARVLLSEFLSGRGEGLAGISASDETNAAAPRAAVEGDKVAPDRSVIQGLVCHPRHENGRSEGFPLNVTNSPVSGLGDVQSEFEPADAGAQGDSGQIGDCREVIILEGM